MRRFWRAVGLDQGDVVYEDRSRNTFENALFTRDLVKPKEGERWLLVTSAMHMPRAVGVFRKVGFPVIAYPVDFRTNGDVLARGRSRRHRVGRLNGRKRHARMAWPYRLSPDGEDGRVVSGAVTQSKRFASRKPS